jgi:hypothetical protein
MSQQNEAREYSGKKLYIYIYILGRIIKQKKIKNNNNNKYFNMRVHCYRALYSKMEFGAKRRTAVPTLLRGSYTKTIAILSHNKFTKIVFDLYFLNIIL